MKTNNTFSIMLLCRPSKKNTSEGLIYARITVNGEQTEISLKEKIAVKQWNVLKQEVDGRSPQTKALNTHLDNVKFKIKEKYRSLLDKDAAITAQIIKDAYLGNQGEPKGHSICELMTYHEKMEGEKLSWGTMKNYVATEDYVKRFIKAKFGKEDLFLKQLNQEFIIEFEYFVRNNPLKQHDPCAGNGLMKHIGKTLKRWYVGAGSWDGSTMILS